ncbi:MAG: CCA tRNA nucleotidyltransferase [Anaerolineae bacterium]|nr:CCA tRNA nucleotidyltransferase [Anaerolineae bacterium]MCI0610523.1 CCA tRNA nucleotidyltransferase [Anaerolineae bacterium]
MERDHSAMLETSLDGLHLELLHLFAYQAAGLQMPLYLVGGVVRDIFLGRAVNDFDLVVEGGIASFAESILKKYGGKILVHSRFGTAKWILNESTFKRLDFPVSRFPDFELSFDLVSARSETYSQPGALPTVERSTIDDDLRRRDFTINAMALRLDGNHYGELIDPLGGEADLERGTIRVIHPKSFIDDPTRIYRAVRYEGRYGFQIEDDTLALIPDARSIIAELSAERIRHELDLILAEPNAASMLARLTELDLLKPIHPVLFFDESANSRLANIGSFRALRRISPWNLDRGEGNKRVLGWLLWLMSLSHNDIGSLNLRLQFTSDFLASLFATSTMFSTLSSFADITPSQCVERLSLYPLNAVEAVYFIAPDEKIKDVFFKYLAEWRHVKPHITGDDLRERGLEPGPRYAEILRRLRAAWLDGEIKSTEQESKLLDKLL